MDRSRRHPTGVAMSPRRIDGVNQLAETKVSTRLVAVMQVLLRQRSLQSPRDIHRCSAYTTAEVPRPGIRIVVAAHRI